MTIMGRNTPGPGVQYSQTPILVTADLHISDRSKDEHRFNLLSWLSAQQKKFEVGATILLGDITDRKDNHSARLVNRIIDGLIDLKPPVYILMGNHDYTDRSNPFFGFLNCIDGIHFVTEPMEPWPGTYLIPHCKDQAQFDAAFKRVNLNAELVCCHQLIDGAIGESNRRLTGLRWPLVGFSPKPATALAGDIHKPQQLDCGVTYVGAPYHIRFGDDFTPRVLLLKGAKQHDLHYAAPRKWVLTITDAVDITEHELLRAKDQLKLVVEIAREEVVEWPTMRKEIADACKARGVELHGTELRVKTTTRLPEKANVKLPKDVFDYYCKREGLPSNVRKAGEELLNDTDRVHV